jgi:hypothetical protein
MAAALPTRVGEGLARFRRRLVLSEVSGAMGDLGTYIPIVVAMCIQYPQLSLRSTLLLSGLASIATGTVFDIPMPVQPMKSIAAVALASDGSEGFGVDTVLAAGILTASFVGVLGLTGLIDDFNRLLPLPIVVRARPARSARPRCSVSALAPATPRSRHRMHRTRTRSRRGGRRRRRRRRRPTGWLLCR